MSLPTPALRVLAPTALLLTARAAAGPSYDPLAVAQARPGTFDLTVQDDARRRQIPLRVYLPGDTRAAPVILFSHGLGGSREGNAYLGTHWAGRGYVVVFLQHAGSDAAVWREAPPRQRRAALERAAGPEALRQRVGDVSAALDQLQRWNGTAGHVLAGRLELERVGMSGHSFGAVTTQAVGGQRGPGGRAFADPRVKAALAMSPSSPRRGGDPARAFGEVAIPWMVMTGTRDLAVIGEADLESRLAVYPALPPGGKYELVLEGAEHSAFSERPLPGDAAPRNPNHHRAVLAVSTAFWDAWLREDASARRWLDGSGPRSVLEAGDRWRRK
jgi:predicted dienelactone hydrolase